MNTVYPNRAIKIEIADLGTLSVSSTEGAIAINLTSAVNGAQVANFNVPEKDFLQPYLDELQSCVAKYDNDATVSLEFAQEAFKRKLTASAACTLFFKRHGFPLDTLTPLKGEVKGFSEQVRELTGPYLPISDEEFDSLVERGSDFYLTNGGSVVLIGGDSTGSVLMPLQDEPARKMINENLSENVVLKTGQAGWYLIEHELTYSTFAFTTKHEMPDGDATEAAFSVHACFVWNTKELSFIVGKDVGHGLCENMRIYDGEEPVIEKIQSILANTKHKDKNNSFARLVEQYPKSWRKIEKAISNFIDIAKNPF
jgi:hypothetical protein